MKNVLSISNNFTLFHLFLQLRKVTHVMYSCGGAGISGGCLSALSADHTNTFEPMALYSLLRVR